MISALTDWIRNVVVIVTIVSFLEMLLPDGNLRRFGRFIMGLVVLFAVVSPLAHLFGTDWNLPTPSPPAAGTEEILEQGRSIVQRGKEYMWRELQAQADSQVSGLVELINGVEDAEVLTQVAGDGNLKKVIVKLRARTAEKPTRQFEEEAAEIGVAPVRPVRVYIGEAGETVDRGAIGESLSALGVAIEEKQDLADRVRRLLTSFYGLDPDQVAVSFVD